MKVGILGTIVSPDYDDEIFNGWISRGVITPSSRVVSAIETATEPIDLYINSYGGDVFAGGEMMIAVLKCHAAGNLRSVEVGSIAASMAANIVAALRAAGASVSAHSNSQLMFHGCYTVTEGGAQHHEDVAESLRNINEAVISNLNRIGVENCRAWFAEGREKWIAADEGLKLGLFSEVAEACAEPPAEARTTASRLAAFAASFKTRKDYSMNIDETIQAEDVKAGETAADQAENTETSAPENEETADAEQQEEVAPAPTTEPAPEPEVQPTTDQKAEQMANERFSALQAKHDKMISDLKANNAKLEADLANAQAYVTSLTDKLAKSETDLADIRNQLEAEKKAHAEVVKGAMKPQPKTYSSNSERIASGMKVEQ